MRRPAHALGALARPSLFLKHTLEMVPDPWQAKVLDSRGDVILNCTRQAGKSTMAAALALHTATTKPGALVIIVSPSLRQSGEMLKKIYDLMNKLPIRPELVGESASEIHIKGGGRILSLPSSEGTIRGFSKVDLIIEDEASRVNDELFQAVRPMLATSGGRIILLSTPDGKSGHYYEIWTHPENYGDWLRIEVPATQIPRIPASFLETERRTLGSRIFSREYMCQFLEDDPNAIFRREWFPIVDSFPAGGHIVRRWDLAATAPKHGTDPDHTAGAKLVRHNGVYYLADMRRIRASPLQVEQLVQQTAQIDGQIPVRMEQEPGSSGVGIIDHYAREVLAGYDFKGVPATGNKLNRAMPVAAAAEAGNIKLVRGAWIQAFLDEACSFPGGDHDDQVDALSGAFADINAKTADPNRFMSIKCGRYDA